MRQRIISVLVITALLLCSSETWAADELIIIKQLDGIENNAAGEVDYTVADGVCQLVVTPAKGNYITHRRIKGEKVISGDYSQSRAKAPNIADTIAVTPISESYDSAKAVTFTFPMPSEEYKVRLTVNFGSLPDIVTYSLWIGQIQVTEYNWVNVLADDSTTVSFSPERNLLVLNNARLEGMPVRSSLDSLTVYLLGKNTISAEQSAPFVNVDATRLVPLKFSTDANVPGTLEATCPTGQLTDGFEVTYEYNLAAVKTDDTHYEIKVPIRPAEFDIENYDGEEAQYTFTAETLQEGDDDIDLSNAVIDGVLYTLSDYAEPDGSGFDDGTTNDDGPGIVLNTEMTPEDIAQVQDLQPGTSEFANGFAGLTIAVPAGIGHFYVDAATEGAYALGIRVGTDEPIIVSGLSKGDIIKVNYATLVPCYVYIYNAGTVEGANEVRPWRGGKKTATHIKVYGVTVEPDVLMGVNSASAIVEGESEPVKVVGASESYYNSVDGGRTGGFVLNDVMGKTVTDLGDNIFEDVDMSHVNYVDLSKSAVKGLVVSRTSGQFAGVDPQTLIFLPKDNLAGNEANVVIDGVCDHLSLDDDAEASFMTPYDFLAEKFDFGRTYVTGQPAGYYMPLELTAEQAAAIGTFHNYKDVVGQQAFFDKAIVGGIHANSPYAFVPKGSKISLDNVSVKAKTMVMTAMPNGLFGTYEKIDAHAADNIYRLETSDKGARFVRLTDGDAIGAFSTYLVASGAADQLEMTVDGVTAITTIHTASARENQWYTADGLRIAGKPSRKGLYIVNGKKFVVE